MRVWVDCTAAAHPLVLRPIVERLRARGHEVEITTREYGQTVGILERLGLEHTVIGSHGGGGAAGKALALARRSRALLGWARPRGFGLALGHGSVDLAVVSSALRIPSAQMQDYEFAGLQRQLAFRAARRVLVPDAIGVEAMRRAGAAERKLFRYPGLKEDYYLADFEPDRRRARRARGRRASRCSLSSARRRRLPPITSATRSMTRCSTGSPQPSGRSRW